MTTLDYWTTDAMKSEVNVLQCLTLEDASIGVILDRTLFHVQGGGQPSDVGFIGEARVLKVVRTEMGIVHLVDREVDEGTVTIVVDKELRLLHSRLHSAGHLIGASLEGMGWRATKGSHQPGQCRVIGVKTDENAAVPTKEAIEAKVNAWIADQLECQVTQVGGLREVTWGDLKAYPCGGTHVKNTCELKGIVIDSVKFKKGELRIAYQLTDTNG